MLKAEKVCKSAQNAQKCAKVRKSAQKWAEVCLMLRRCGLIANKLLFDSTLIVNSGSKVDCFSSEIVAESLCRSGHKVLTSLD